MLSGSYDEKPYKDDIDCGGFGHSIIGVYSSCIVRDITDEKRQSDNLVQA
jgi:hypothetical protein